MFYSPVAKHFDDFHDAYIETHGEIIQAFQSKKPTEILDKVIEEGAIKDSDLVLDCGSGAGFPAHYISEKTGCFVTGLNISDKQLKYSKKYKSERCVFLKHDFQDNFAYFKPDKIIFLETFCYAKKPADLLSRLYDSLSFGGRVVIKDFSCVTRGWSRKAWLEINEFYGAEFHSPKDLIGWAYDAGFKVLKFERLFSNDLNVVTADFIKKTGSGVLTPSFVPFILVLEKPKHNEVV